MEDPNLQIRDLFDQHSRDLFDRIGYLIKEVERIDKENPTGPDEETDPRIVAMLAEMWEIQKELDPIVRATLHDRPAAIAEWDEIMHMCDDIPPEERSS